MAISLGGGGSASVINETIDINSAENLITLDDGRVYLKGGVTETNVSAYPDATQGFAYTGTNFSTAGQTNAQQDIAWDGTYFYIADDQNNRVLKYTAAGTYQTSLFSTASQDGQMWGIVCVGSDFYLCGNGNDKVYKYNSAGVFQSDFSLASQLTTPHAITYDGTYLWVLGDVSGSENVAYKYTTAGVYQNVSFSTDAQDIYSRGLAWDGTSFWVTGNSTDRVYKYNSSGVYQNVSFNVAGTGLKPLGVVWDSSALWILDEDAQTISKYADQLGVTNNASASQIANGRQNYIRIK